MGSPMLAKHNSSPMCEYDLNVAERNGTVPHILKGNVDSCNASNVRGFRQSMGVNIDLAFFIIAKHVRPPYNDNAVLAENG